MAKMGINAGGAIEIWSPRMKSWHIEDVDHSMDIKGCRELLVRFLGVTHCPGFEELIGEAVSVQQITASDNAKRQLDTDSDDMSLMIETRRAAASTWLPSTPSSMSPSPPFSFSSSASVTPFPSSPLLSLVGLDPMQNLDPNSTNLPAITTFSPANPFPELVFSSNTIPDYDALWLRGSAHVPDTTLWPSGMYARDMAWGLTKLNESRNKPEQRFHEVFPGVRYVKATYYRQRDAFFKSTTREIEQCRALGRSANGLWMDWRGNSSGWKKVAARARASNT